jgi:inorganic phosphate transporter, PiT family
MDADVILVIVVATALGFDFTNGFHDTANVVATSISTRAIAPRLAVTCAALLNFAGAFISLKVAAAIANDIVDPSAITMQMVFAGLVGAIAWNIITWWLGLPSSSSHALIGGLVGAAIVAAGTGVISGEGILDKVVVPAVIAPILAFVVAGIGILWAYRIVARLRPGPTARGFRAGELLSGGLLALSHGTNDAQKTMGIITLALVAHGNIDPAHFHIPDWVVVASATSIAAGTYIGGWRIIKTMGSKIIKMDPAQGFAAQASGASVILAASHAGFPLSTTHVINGGIMGAGAAKRLSAVRWGVAGNIALAWVVTLPAAAIIGGATYAVVHVFGKGAAGPIVVTVILVGVLSVVFLRRNASVAPGAAAPEAGS